MTPEDILLSVAPRNGQATRLVIAMFGDKEVFRDKINTDTSRDREKFFLKLSEETGVDAAELKKAHESPLIQRAESIELEAIETVAEEMKPRSKRPTSRRPVMLPGESSTITEAAEKLGNMLADTGRFYLRGGIPMRAVVVDGEVRLEQLRAAAACSDFDTVADLIRMRATKDGVVEVSAVCSETSAKQIIDSQAFRTALPKITVLSRCPVLLERDGALKTICGYDRDSGIWAMGEKPAEMTLDAAREYLNTLVAEFNFVTPADRSRALAAFITPALVFGGLLGGRAPIDLGEADQSQSGKGFRYKLVAAVYRSKPRAVTQRERGVGSMQETFDTALISGACFIYFDNLRGKLESAGIESFMTEPVYFARIPYSSPMEIDATRTSLGATTNKAELTRDMTNRSAVVRILKRGDDYQFRKFDEGDLLDHVQANQGKFLGAVFAIIREWHKQGKPQQAAAAHDFRRWGTSLGWIVENILGAAPLVEGHRAIQERMSSPVGNWLRDLALAVRSAGKLGERLRAYQLLNIVVEAGIKTSGIPEDLDLADEAAFGKGSRAIGMQMSRAVKGGSVVMDDIIVSRHDGQDTSFRPVKEYEFGNLGTPQPSNHPEEKRLSPEPPQPLPTSPRQPLNTPLYKSVALVPGVAGSGDLLAGSCGDSSSSGVETWEF